MTKTSIMPVVRLAAAMAAALAAAGAAPLTEADKKAGLEELERTRTAVVQATTGLSEAQWRFKPGPDRWSIAEVVEHIAVTEQALLGFIQGQVMKAPAGKPDRDVKSLDEKVLTAIADRSRRVQAPKEVAPQGRWAPKESLDQFLKNRAATVAFLTSAPGLRDHVEDSPLGQPLDAYQWVLYIAAHSERHTKQIQEVKASAGFPTN